MTLRNYYVKNNKNNGPTDYNYVNTRTRISDEFFFNDEYISSVKKKEKMQKNIFLKLYSLQKMKVYPVSLLTNTVNSTKLFKQYTQAQLHVSTTCLA